MFNIRLLQFKKAGGSLFIDPFSFPHSIYIGKYRCEIWLIKKVQLKLQTSAEGMRGTYIFFDLGLVLNIIMNCTSLHTDVVNKRKSLIEKE